jgi:hypothetical protein
MIRILLHDSMRKVLICLAVLLILFFTQGIYSQKAPGTWTDHFPYNQGSRVEYTSKGVYCLASGNLFFFNTSDNSVEKLSKINGLRDVEITTIAYSSSKDVLLVAYSNANIDLVRGRDIKNVPYIARKGIVGNTRINNVHFRDNLAYLACGFGIVVINIDRDEIFDTYIIGDAGTNLEVNQVSSDASYLYAATTKGLLRADIDHPFLVDFNTWKKPEGIPEAHRPFTRFLNFNGFLVAGYLDIDNKEMLITNQHGSWNALPGFVPGETIHELRVSGGFLTLVQGDRVMAYNEELVLVRNISNYLDSSMPRSVYFDAAGETWIADFGQGLVRGNASGYTSTYPNGPASAGAYHIATKGNQVYVSRGGITGTWNTSLNPAQVNHFLDGQWKTYTYPGIDASWILIDPANDQKLYVTAWGTGVIEAELDKLIQVHNETNSSLKAILAGFPSTRVAGIAMDKDRNLWMTNTGVAENLVLRTSEGEWKSFDISQYTDNAAIFSQIMALENGHLWIVMPRGNGFLVVDTKGTAADGSDDLVRRFKPYDAYEDIINDVVCMALDKNGYMWLGTEKGPVVYYNPDRIFTEGYSRGQQILIPRKDGTMDADVLLGNDVITAIAVDGADRKWFGTESGGAFLISKDGSQQVLNFNVSNSPLPSNTIRSIGINQVSGEVYFGTDKGLVSYRGLATEGGEFFRDVYVYPNPVRENFHGDIVISGLVKDSNVKITDIAGNLVFETTSLGGQAVWDGRNFSGQRVKTGIYLVFLTSPDGLKSHVAKLMFIN